MIREPVAQTQRLVSEGAGFDEQSQIVGRERLDMAQLEEEKQAYPFGWQAERGGLDDELVQEVTGGGRGRLQPHKRRCAEEVWQLFHDDVSRGAVKHGLEVVEAVPQAFTAGALSFVALAVSILIEGRVVLALWREAAHCGYAVSPFILALASSVCHARGVFQHGVAAEDLRNRP